MLTSWVRILSPRDKHLTSPQVPPFTSYALSKTHLHLYSKLSEIPFTVITYSTLSTKMSSNTKYQPAPQRDSFDEGNYSQAPPSYQAEGNTNDTLLGAPRGEDDNIPDDFKVDSTMFTVPLLALKANVYAVWWFGC